MISFLMENIHKADKKLISFLLQIFLIVQLKFI